MSQILDKNLLPHLGDSIHDRTKKGIYLGRMARALLELYLGIRKEDDKDHLANKRIKLSGDLLEELFRSSAQALLKDLKGQLEKDLQQEEGNKAQRCSEARCSEREVEARNLDWKLDRRKDGSVTAS